MKKKILAAALVLSLGLALCACSKENIVTGYKSGDVTLGQYTGLEYVPLSTEVSEEDVEERLDNFVSNHKERNEITDRTDVRDGDIANIDYTGYIDGEVFDGGSAAGADLTIGSGRFIDGFESGLIGTNVGETVDLQLQFPDPYPNNTDYSGKDVTFTVTVNGIYEEHLPELTDELVAENTTSTTVEEYRESIRASLKEGLEADAESQKEYDVVKAAIANATFKKDLTDEISEQKQTIIETYNQMYAAYGFDAATLFSYMYGMDAAAFDAAMNEQAELTTKFKYVQSAIAEKEGFESTDEEVTALAQEMADAYGYETLEELYAVLKQNFNADAKDVLAEQVKLNKAEQLLYDTAVAVAETNE